MFRFRVKLLGKKRKNLEKEKLRKGNIVVRVILLISQSSSPPSSAPSKLS
jgi:hypothetical protein